MSIEGVYEQIGAIRGLLAGNHVGEAAGRLAALEEDFKELQREIGRKRIQLETVVETVCKVNARGLDLEAVESYTLNAVGGQFAVPRRAILRKADPTSSKIVASRAKGMRLPELSIELGGPLGAFLLSPDQRGLLPIEGEILSFPEAYKLGEAGLRWLLPLIRSGEDQEELMGMLALGARATGSGFSPTEQELLGLIGDMVAIALHNASLYHRSIFDDLTQVYSRGYFDLHLAQELDRIRRYGKEDDRYLSLALLDVDHFKRFNDNYGHQTGDRVLVEVAQSLRDALRTTDVVARYGGEEFGIILLETPRDKCRLVAERLRERVASAQVMDGDGQPLRVTASLGLATYPADADNTVALVREADKALYRAKELGRNRIELAGGG